MKAKTPIEKQQQQKIREKDAAIYDLRRLNAELQDQRDSYRRSADRLAVDVTDKQREVRDLKHERDNYGKEARALEIAWNEERKRLHEELKRLHLERAELSVSYNRLVSENDRLRHGACDTSKPMISRQD